MTTSLSPEIDAVLRALGAVGGFKRATKFTRRGGMLYVGDFKAVELRIVQTAPGYEVSVVLEKLASVINFRVAAGCPMRNYGLIAEHTLRTDQGNVKFFTLPSGFFASEFIEAFSGEVAIRNLGNVCRSSWPIVLASQQIEVIVPLDASEEEICSNMKKVLELATHRPYR